MSATRGGVGVLVAAACAVLLGSCTGAGGGTAGPTAPGPTATAGASSGPSGAGGLPPEATYTLQGSPSPAEVRQVADRLQRRAQTMGLAAPKVEVRGAAVSLSAAGATREQFAALAQQGHLGFRPVLALAPSVPNGAPAQGAVSADPTTTLQVPNCSDAAQRTDRQSASGKPAVACGYAAENGIWYGFALGPVAVDGTDVSAVKAVEDTQNGAGWQIDLTFDAVGAQAFADVTGRLAAQPSPANQFAIVLDGAVVSHPAVASAVPGGAAVISGSFTEAEARRLAALIGNRLPVPLLLTETTLPN
ncbi:hypothetical protein ACFXDE_23995 [Kitasatospora sp. NPDC059408]|uniref:SecDF P1 head subdomain-containing protein n=1 Tax=Kitasatospora sp. NPDC059408 TaxID=3346823 RepID=UPI0036AD2F3D